MSQFFKYWRSVLSPLMVRKEVIGDVITQPLLQGLPLLTEVISKGFLGPTSFSFVTTDFRCQLDWIKYLIKW